MIISVVVATYNRAPVLRRVLDAWALQSLRDFEVIVVDDGSTDDTPEVAQSYKFVRYVRENRQASPRLFNVGWRMASANIVMLCDDDYLCPPRLLAAVIDGFHRCPHAAAVGCYATPPQGLVPINRFARYDEWEWRYHGGTLEEYEGGAETPTAGAVAYRRSVLEEAGGFDERLLITGAHDHDIKHRLTALGHRFVYLPVKIDHCRSYDAQSFREQHRGRGRAVARYEWVTRGRGPGYPRIVLRLLKRTALSGWRLLRMATDPALAWTIYEAEFHNCVGQWKEQRCLYRR